MADTTNTILIDKDLRPAYYDDFHCLAQGCKISCCKGWSITFNKRDYLSLRRQTGSPDLTARMEGTVRRIRKGPMAEKFYGEFNMDSGVCPLLREDGLCQLQMENGHEVLPFVCQGYPRAEAGMPSGYLERSLSPSCEGVLELLWNLPEGVDFRTDPLPKEQHQRVAFHGDNPLPRWFAVVREWCVDLLQNRQYTLPQRVWLMGLRLKELADGETDIGRWMERAAVLPEPADVEGVLPTGEAELKMLLGDCVNTVLGMRSGDPVLRPVRDQLLAALELEVQTLAQQTGKATLAFSTVPYHQAREACEKEYAGRDFFMENLMVTAFFHLHLPCVTSREDLWKGYVNFCNLYAVYRFLAVMSCREGVEDRKAELFRLVVFASRALLHNSVRQNQLRDELFQNDSATLAHMAILLSG